MCGCGEKLRPAAESVRAGEGVAAAAVEAHARSAGKSDGQPAVRACVRFEGRGGAHFLVLDRLDDCDVSWMVFAVGLIDY